jgi:pimeloyl-ACP methyl ester carboxylesterase
MTRPPYPAFFARLALGIAAALACVLCAGLARAASTPGSIRVGSMLLERCSDAPGYCGRLDRPLDPVGTIPGRISIYFEFYPHTGPGESLGTLVSTEGGPGYSATESRDEYLALWAPLRQSRDFLVMDNRGTGKSAAIDCNALQTAAMWTVELIAACGDSLGSRAPLYSTAYAADDLAAILAKLNVERIDLYGDSYGTYFEQVFALRHPGALRSIVLDGAYALKGPDYAWYPTYAPAMRAKFDIACERSQSCAKFPGSSIDHIRPVIDRLRANPFPATAPDGDGQERTFTADAAHLAAVMFASAPDFASVRELDAAARSFLEGDRAPLLRLMAETISGVDSRDPAADATKWSAGLAAAVMCQDQPQIFDMRLAPRLRAADRDRALAERRRTFPDTYAPFTIDEYRGIPLDYAFIDQCVAWPVPPPDHPAAALAPAGAAYPDVPALILSGELDNITTMADGAAVASAFKHGRQVRVANGFHVNALARGHGTCTADIVRHFVATLDPGDLSCASQVPAVRLVPRFATRSEQLEPATSLTGNAASTLQLQFVSAAVMTAGDVLARVAGNTPARRGSGLRGGTFQVTRRGGDARVALEAVRWTQDLAVSGMIDKRSGPTGVVEAHLEVQGPDGLTGHLTVRWQGDASMALAQIHGVIGGAVVAAQAPAP